MSSKIKKKKRNVKESGYKILFFMLSEIKGWKDQLN